MPIDLTSFRLRSPRPARLAVALVLFTLAVLLRILVLRDSTAFPFVTFYPATLAAFYLCGLLPGAVVALLCTVAGYWFTTRSFGGFRYEQAAMVVSLVFLAGSGLMAFLVRQIHQLLDRNARSLKTLEVTEARYRRLVENSPDTVYVFSNARGGIYYSPKARELLGYPLEYLHAHPNIWNESIHPDDRARVDEAVRASAQGEPFRVEYRLRHASGDWRWVYDRSIERHSEGGETFIEGLATDITDRKEAEAQLQSARNKLQATLNALPDLLFEVGSDGRILDFHSPRTDLLAAPPEAFLGRTFAEFLPPRVTAVVNAALREAMLNGFSSGRTYALDLPAGRRWFELSIAAKDTSRDEDGRLIVLARDVTDPDGEQGRLVMLARDITDRKQAEEALTRHRDHLEELVAERTRDLVQAKEAAERESLAKAAFVANMSHEIRTPMNSILGFAYLMRERIKDPELVEHLGHLTDSARHLLGVINDILDLSKINAGKMTLEARPFAPLAMVEGVTSMLAPLARAKGLAVEVGFEGVPGRVIGDETRLTQVLTNLLSNAIKFTERGGVGIRLRAQERTADAMLLRVEVADTGIGIPSEVQLRLFADFEQADEATSRAFGGTGLGLAITRRIVDLMGGEVGVQSTPGVGSTFWFTARLGVVRSEEAESDSAARAPSDVAPIIDSLLEAHLGKRVLVVEDDPANRKVAVAMLRRAGLAVEVAEDGAAAVERMNRNGEDAFDLILMDKHMPGIDGLEATRRIRSNPANAKVPVLAMTADAFVDERQRCLAAGMDDFIAKPVDPGQFYEAVLRGLTTVR